MFAWVGWLLVASPLLVAAFHALDVPLVVLVIAWPVATVVLYVKTWGKYGVRQSPADRS